MAKSKYILFALIVLLSIFSAVVRPGYSAFSGDQEVYMPAIYRSLGLAGYSGDILSEFDQSKYTFFDEAISWLIKISNIDIFYLFAALALLFRAIYFYAIYALARHFTGNKVFAVIAMFLFSQDFWLYGSSTAMLESSLIPRAVALPLALLALACFLNKRQVTAGLLIVASALMHPITAVPFVLFFYLRTAISFVNNLNSVASSRNGKCVRDEARIFHKTRNKLPHAFILFALPTALAFILLYFFLPMRIDAVWESIIRARVPYLLISAWPATAFAYLALNTLFLKISISRILRDLSETSKKLDIALLLAVPVLLFVLSFVLVDLLKFQFIAQLQLHRGMVLYKLLALMFFAYYAYSEITLTRRLMPLTTTNSNPKSTSHRFIFLALIAGLFIKEYVLFILLPLLLLVWLEKHNFISAAPASKLLFIYLLASGVLSFWLGADLFKYYAIAVCLAALLAAIITLKRKPGAICSAMLILMLISIIIFAPWFNIAPAYRSNTALMDACAWLKNNTPKDSLIISEPFSKVSTPIRLDCYRAVFSSKKDGAQTIFSRAYAIEWAKRNALLSELQANPDNFSEILGNYSVNYLVSESPINASLPIIFQNSKYFIYKTTV